MAELTTADHHGRVAERIGEQFERQIEFFPGYTTSIYSLSRGLFGFLEELRCNNRREWFEANRARYERDVCEPMLAFISDFAPGLRKISPKLVADPRPSGGSMFCIYRDVRFSPDKRPYKTHVAARFSHVMGRDVHAPGFYIHMEPSGVFCAAGIWHPDRATLARIRDFIVKHPAQWKTAINDAKFRQLCALEGDVLSHPPKGYDLAHPLIKNLNARTSSQSPIST